MITTADFETITTEFTAGRLHFGRSGTKGARAYFVCPTWDSNTKIPAKYCSKSEMLAMVWESLQRGASAKVVVTAADFETITAADVKSRAQLTTKLTTAALILPPHL